jgi:hypothetical protein
VSEIVFRIESQNWYSGCSISAGILHKVSELVFKMKYQAVFRIEYQSWYSSGWGED